MAKFTSIGKLTKTPSDGTLLERTSKRFLWCWLLLLFFPNWRFLRFRATFPCHRHSTPASQAHKGLHRLWALPWLLSVAFLFARLFPTQLYRERYGFEWAFFTHRRFLPYAPSQHFWHNLLLSRLPWEPAVIPWNLQGFILILKTQTRPICLFDSQ